MDKCEFSVGVTNGTYNCMCRNQMTDYGSTASNKCFDNKDCYYKQLQTITAERDRYEQTLKSIKYYCEADSSNCLSKEPIINAIKQALEGNK